MLKRLWNHTKSLTILSGVLFTLLFSSSQAEASHYRGGTISYEYVSGRTVKVKLDVAFRRGFFSCYQQSDGCINDFINPGTLYFGDGSSVSASVKVYYDEPSRGSNGLLYAAATFQHTYSGSSTGPYTAYFTNCCWISGAVGEQGSSWKLESKVYLTGNNGPTMDSPIYYEWCPGVPFRINVNASDKDNDPLSYRLRWRPSNVSNAIPNNEKMTIDQLGTIEWSNPRTGMWVASPEVNDPGNATAHRDFLLVVLSSCNNFVPVISVTPTALATKPGQQTCATVNSSDGDPHELSFQISPLKNGATGAPAPDRTSPYQFQYCWTPSASDVGVHNIMFTVKDNGPPNLTSFTMLQITVAAGDPPTIEGTGTFAGSKNTTFSFSLNIADPDGGSINSSHLSNLPSFCTPVKVSHALYNVSCSPTDSDANGNYTFTTTGTDSSGETSTKSFVVTVRDNDPPSKPSLTIVQELCKNKLMYSAADSDGTIAGYTIERGLTSTGPFYPLEAGSTLSETYYDTNLIHGTAYYYRVKAKDNKDASSDYSEVFQADGDCLKAVNDILIGYEDMIGDGNNDWDYNDFVVRMQSTMNLNGKKLSQIVVGLEALARGASYDHEYRLRVPLIQGNYTYEIKKYASRSGALLSTSTGSGTNDFDVQIWKTTKEALPPQNVPGYVFATNTAGSTHQAGQYVELTINLDEEKNKKSTLHPKLFDGYLKVTYLPGAPEIHVGSFCSVCQENVGTPAYQKAAGVYGTNLPFTVRFAFDETSSFRWALEATPNWSAFPGFSASTIMDINWVASKQNDKTWNLWNP